MFKLGPAILFLIITFFPCFILSQNSLEPKFGIFKGDVYRLPLDSLNKGFRPYIYDLPVYSSIEWDSLNFSSRSSKEYYPGIDLSQAFGILFRNTLEIESDGLYVFGLRSDDESMLWINEKLILDNSNNGFIGNRAPMDLAADTSFLRSGIHEIKIWYSQLYPNKMGIQFKSKFVQEIEKPELSGLSLTYDSAEYILTDYHKSQIRDWIERNNSLIINKGLELLGYADEIGSVEDNFVLSKRRAEAVADYLNLIFTKEIRIEIVPKGEILGIGPDKRVVMVQFIN